MLTRSGTNPYALLLALLSASAVAEEAILDAVDRHYLKRKQFEWLRTKGGYVNEKVGFEPPPGHPPGAGGMFALEDIKEGEKIFHIPTNVLIGPYPHSRRRSVCETAERIVDEYHKREKGEFWPYVQYVFEQFPHHSVPPGWSFEGKRLVNNIVGPDLLEPQQFGEWIPRCEWHLGDGDYDEHETLMLNAAHRIVYSRAWEEVLVPVYDMANHQNGYWHNIDQLYNSKTHPDPFHIIALRDIMAGEQLCLSYTECHDYTCFGKEMDEVTPEIFADYGFVEQLPQRWSFYTIDGDFEKGRLLFNLDRVNETSKDNSEDLKVEWISDFPDADGLEYLHVHLKRLRGMEDYVMYEAKRLNSESERFAALDYYQSLTRALEYAIAWAHGDPRRGSRDKPLYGASNVTGAVAQQEGSVRGACNGAGSQPVSI